MKIVDIFSLLQWPWCRAESKDDNNDKSTETTQSKNIQEMNRLPTESEDNKERTSKTTDDSLKALVRRVRNNQDGHEVELTIKDKKSKKTRNSLRSLVDTVRNNQDNHEVELVCEDCHHEGVREWEKCMKNPGHHHFYRYKDLTIHDLPAEWRSEENLQFVKDVGKRTVRLRLDFTSWERPDHDPFAKVRGTDATRMGTGNVYDDEVEVEECMFDDCPVTPKPHNVVTFNLSTAKHVIYNDEEAEETTVDFFYDCVGGEACDNHKECKKRMVAAWGTEVLWTDKVKDATLMRCACHDLDIFNKFKFRNAKLRLPREKGEISFIVSHPHGVAKQVTFGHVHKLLRMEQEEQPVVESDGNVWFRRSFTKALYNMDTCPGTSGAAVFSFTHGHKEDGITHALHNKCCQTCCGSSKQFNGSNVGHVHTREHGLALEIFGGSFGKRGRFEIDMWKGEFYRRFGGFLMELFRGGKSKGEGEE